MLIVMNLSRPWAVIRTPLDMEVIRVLRGTTRPLTGREVARVAREGSQPAINAALRRLTDEGIVRAEEAGNAYLHTLNRKHLVVCETTGAPCGAFIRPTPNFQLRHTSGAIGPFSGRWIENSLPDPGFDSTSILPPWARTIL